MSCRLCCMETQGSVNVTSPQFLSVWLVERAAGGESVGAFIPFIPFIQNCSSIICHLAWISEKFWIWKEDSIANKIIGKPPPKGNHALWIVSGVVGGQWWEMKGRFPMEGRRGSPAKNGTVNILTSGVNLEESGSTCLSQLLWEVLLAQESRAAAKGCLRNKQAVFRK